MIDIFRTRLTDTNLVGTRGESGLSVTSAYEIIVEDSVCGGGVLFVWLFGNVLDCVFTHGGNVRSETRETSIATLSPIVQE